jgi:general secretion pathway protein L
MALIDALKRPWGGLARRSWASAPRPSGERFVACLPTPVRRYLARRDRRLVIRADGPGAHLEWIAGETREVLGTLDLGGREPLPGVLADRSKDQHRRTILLLPATAVLTRRTSLPAQVRDNLATVLRYELDRLSPFRPEQVVYDSRVVGGGKGEARLTLDLALARRDLVEGWLKRLREAGSPVDQVTWEGAWPKANLLPPAERPRHRQPLLDPGKLLLALILLLGAGVLVTPLWQRSRTLETLESEVRKARTQAVQVDQVRQELERARRGSTEVRRQKWELPRMLDMLRELTERIPDDTWVQSLEYQSGEVQVRGESGRATALIGLLEGAPGISGVSFRSPVTQVAQTGKERFNLAFNYKRAEPAPP